MIIDKLMTRRVVSVSMDEKLSRLREIFESTRFHHILVVERGRLKGVISDRDLLKTLSPYLDTAAETAHDAATLNHRAHQIMSRTPITIGPEADVHDAISLFNAHTISCLPVVRDDEVVGILTWRDILRALEARRQKMHPPAP